MRNLEVRQCLKRPQLRTRGDPQSLTSKLQVAQSAQCRSHIIMTAPCSQRPLCARRAIRTRPEAGSLSRWVARGAFAAASPPTAGFFRAPANAWFTSASSSQKTYPPPSSAPASFARGCFGRLSVMRVAKEWRCKSWRGRSIGSIASFVDRRAAKCASARSAVRA